MRKAAAATIVGASGGFVALYSTQPGFQRTVQFWSTMGPTIAEYKLIKYKVEWLEGLDHENDPELESFHNRTAAKAVDIILSLGGIYVKLGQLISTVGTGIFEDVYVDALAPLQDGVPPRSLAEISTIIEKDTGRPMRALFSSFDAVPVGAASVAQAHKATLLDGREVIVKVQYPEVRDYYKADFDNLEMLATWLMPANVPLVQGLRRRHEGELDFRHEALNLAQCKQNMQQRGFDPGLVRLPTLPAPDLLCTELVLAMEFLKGRSLSDAIEHEQGEMAAALGLQGGAAELKARIMGAVRKKFREGQGVERAEERSVALVSTSTAEESAAATAAIPEVGSRSLEQPSPSLLERVLQSQLIVQYGAAALRIYASCRKRLLSFWTASSSAAHIESEGGIGDVDLGVKLKDLVHVHGAQLLLDGVYNADPHPGNVLLLDDGRLGLIDYGMVGRLALPQRILVAKVILALANDDTEAVVKLYADAGYRAVSHSGVPLSAAVVARIARFHLDRIDLSPVDTGGGEMRSIFKVLQQTIELSVPDWIEQSRRLGGLLIGVASQMGRPISLANEWAPIARQLLEEHGEL